MRQFFLALWRDCDGVLSFEWTILAVLLVIGIVSGLSAARDAIIDELGDHAEAVLQFDQSYSFAGIPALGIPASTYTDSLGTVTDCGRSTLLPINTLNDGT
ncbi:MAG: hypothetical protein SFU86_00660 [Pirellulaceae bacterium]|nr:hypothetical protein [Pirellulaceae bacterium]